MCGSVVVLRYALGVLRVVRVVVVVAVLHLVAVLMIAHVRVHVGVVVAVVTRLAVVVVRREVAIVVRRVPAAVTIVAIAVEHRRTTNEYRLDDVAGTVDVGVTYHLYVRACAVSLHYDGGYVLIDVLSQNSLDHVEVVVAVHSLHYAEVVHVAVAVEVEVGDHVLIGVEDLFELFHGVGLSESGSHGLEVEIKTDIRRYRANLYSRGGGHLLCRYANGSGRVIRVGGVGLLGVRRGGVTDRSSRIGYGNDAGEASRAAHRYCYQHDEILNFTHMGLILDVRRGMVVRKCEILMGCDRVTLVTGYSIPSQR